MESEGLDEAWQPIAVDGQLGPQTAGGFAQLAKRLPAETMASVFDLGPSYLGPSYLGGGAPSARKAKAASQMPQLSARDPNPRRRLQGGML